MMWPTKLIITVCRPAYDFKCLENKVKVTQKVEHFNMKSCIYKWAGAWKYELLQDSVACLTTLANKTKMFLSAKLQEGKMTEN